MAYIFAVELFEVLCAEVLWRISVSERGTKAVAVGIDRAGRFVFREQAHPSDLNIFELFFALPYVWALPDTVQGLWFDGEQLLSNERKAADLESFPDVEDPYGVSAELLSNAYRAKVYTLTHPCEVILQVGDIKSG